MNTEPRYCFIHSSIEFADHKFTSERYEKNLQSILDSMLSKKGTDLMYIDVHSELEKRKIKFNPLKVNSYISGMKKALKLKNEGADRIGISTCRELIRTFQWVIGFRDSIGVERSDDFKYSLNDIMDEIKNRVNLNPNILDVKEVKRENDPTLENVVSRHIPKYIRMSNERKNAIRRMTERVLEESALEEFYYNDDKGVCRVYNVHRSQLNKFLKEINVKEYLAEIVQALK